MEVRFSGVDPTHLEPTLEVIDMKNETNLSPTVVGIFFRHKRIEVGGEACE